MKFKPKKKLGQNFLIDKNIINLIVKLGEIKNDDTILEIGPGTGNLTNHILKYEPKKFFAIEMDRNLYSKLKTKFKSLKTRFSF